MEATSFWTVVMKRSDGVLIPAVEGLSPEELRAQPAGSETNPIGWLTWHLDKVQDDYLSLISGSPTVWERDDWNSRFPNAEHALHIEPKDVGTFDPVDAPTLLEYHVAVRKRGGEVMADLVPDDFEKVLDPIYPTGKPMAIADILAMVVSDTIQHVGQVAYLRGMLRDQGWYSGRRPVS
jgi:uncharacterized damage-inducible protein DinB